MTGAAVGIGVGTAIAAKAAPSVVPAFSTMGSMMSPVVTGVMGYHAVKGLGRLSKASRKRGCRCRNKRLS